MGWKNNQYPYRIRINDPELVNVLKIVSVKRSARIPNKQVAIKMGKKLKPVRRDVFLGFDNRYYRSFIGLPPNLDLEYIPVGKGYDFIFKTLLQKRDFFLCY